MREFNIEETLKQQVGDIMNEKDTKTNKKTDNRSGKAGNRKGRKKKRNIFLRTLLIIMGLLLSVTFLLIGTKSGRSNIYRVAGNFIYSNVSNDEQTKEDKGAKNERPVAEDVRWEDHVTNYLIIGLEEIKGAKNTDTIMIATINTKSKSLKLTSLLRDTYVEIPGYKPNKLNSAYAKGGAKLLIETIELNYKIRIDGYASVNFESFEKIVDLVGGATIELGEKEAKYLNRTNYISKKENRNVKAGVNKLNGNQLLGYCRVRKVATLGGANNDYGRVVRQQRAVKALFKSYMSLGPIKILNVTKEALGYIKTDLTAAQIETAIADVLENKLMDIETFRIPVDGYFEAPKKYNGIGYPLVLDWDANREKLEKFIFDDLVEDGK